MTYHAYRRDGGSVVLWELDTERRAAVNEGSLGERRWRGSFQGGS
jgi:hypothetical protein